MSKIKNGGFDQYGTEPFEQQQFGTTVTEGVNLCYWDHKFTGCAMKKYWCHTLLGIHWSLSHC